MGGQRRKSDSSSTPKTQPSNPRRRHSSGDPFEYIDCSISKSLRRTASNLVRVEGDGEVSSLATEVEVSPEVVTDPILKPQDPVQTARDDLFKTSRNSDKMAAHPEQSTSVGACDDGASTEPNDSDDRSPPPPILVAQFKELAISLGALKGSDLPPAIQRLLSSIESKKAHLEEALKPCTIATATLAQLSQVIGSQKQSMPDLLSDWGQHLHHMHTFLEDHRESIDLQHGMMPAVGHCLISLGRLTETVDLWTKGRLHPEASDKGHAVDIAYQTQESAPMRTWRDVVKQMLTPCDEIPAASMRCETHRSTNSARHEKRSSLVDTCDSIPSDAVHGALNKVVEIQMAGVANKPSECTHFVDDICGSSCTTECPSPMYGSSHTTECASSACMDSASTKPDATNEDSASTKPDATNEDLGCDVDASKLDSVSTDPTVKSEDIGCDSDAPKLETLASKEVPVAISPPQCWMEGGSPTLKPRAPAKGMQCRSRPPRLNVHRKNLLGEVFPLKKLDVLPGGAGPKQSDASESFTAKVDEIGNGDSIGSQQTYRRRSILWRSCARYTKDWSPRRTQSLSPPRDDGLLFEPSKGAAEEQHATLLMNSLSREFQRERANLHQLGQKVERSQAELEPVSPKTHRRRDSRPITHLLDDESSLRLKTDGGFGVPSAFVSAPSELYALKSPPLQRPRVLPPLREQLVSSQSTHRSV